MKLLLLLWIVAGLPIGYLVGRLVEGRTKPTASKPECYCKGDPADLIHEDYDEYGI